MNVLGGKKQIKPFYVECACSPRELAQSTPVSSHSQETLIGNSK